MMHTLEVKEDQKVSERVAVILDKDPFFRDFQCFLLARQGFHPRCPEAPEDFNADWVRAQRPSIVISEILLPGKNGLDLARELKGPPPLGCPVIVYSVLDVKDRALAAGADKFLHKPVMREGYLSAVKSVTEPKHLEPLHGSS